MTWVPGQPILTESDEREWRAWRKARILKGQRARRRKYRRIDYYPSTEAQAVIDASCFHGMGGDYSSVIDGLILNVATRDPNLMKMLRWRGLLPE
jgi:hypothetical protein